MAYEFNAHELEQIDAAYMVAKSGGVPWWSLYEKVSTILQMAIDRGSVAAEDLRETEAAMLWFDGAVEVNMGKGIF